MSVSSKLTSLKLCFNGEIRRLSLASDTLTYQELMSKTLSVFPDLTSIQFSWVDDEDDRVVISSSEELTEALRVMSSENKGCLRFEVLAQGGSRLQAPAFHPTASPSSSCFVPNSGKPSAAFGTITHIGVECDCCGSSPMIGSRFKCTVRNDFDLCQTCEHMLSHPYPMVKIYRPDQVPAGILVIVDEGRGKMPGLASNCHQDVVCDSCRVPNFHGARFKCSVRENYDLCEACEARDSHEHVMVKIYPKHAGMHIQIIPKIAAGLPSQGQRGQDRDLFGCISPPFPDAHHHGPASSHPAPSAAAGEDFSKTPLRELAELCRQLGFTEEDLKLMQRFDMERFIHNATTGAKNLFQGDEFVAALGGGPGESHHRPHGRGHPHPAHGPHSAHPHPHGHHPGHPHPGHKWPGHPHPGHKWPGLPHHQHPHHQHRGCPRPMDAQPAHPRCGGGKGGRRGGMNRNYWARTAVAQAAADRAQQHAAAKAEEQRAHETKENTLLEDDLLEMCIQESLAEKSRLATAASPASTTVNDEFVAERARLRALAFDLYGPAGMNTIPMESEFNSNEKKSEAQAQAQAHHPVLKSWKPPIGRSSGPSALDSNENSDEKMGEGEGEEKCQHDHVPPPASAPPAPPAPPAKLMCRFVKDVTMPDGSEVVPHSTFFKTWRVRNDGQGDWPEGCHLVAAGGDPLHDSRRGGDYVHREPVPAARAGDEVEMTLELWAPEIAGRHVGYFRLEGPEGNYFGQRLWADVRVTEAEMSADMTMSPWEVVDSAFPEEEQEEQEEGGDVLCSEHDRERLLDATPLLQPVSSVPSTEQVRRELDLSIWSDELRVLSDMGFNDFDLLLPLLKIHIKVPAALNGESGSEAGLQTVVMTLLQLQE